MLLGISTILVKILMPVRPKISRKMLARNSAPTMNQNICGCSIISIGPGFRPWMNSAPMMTPIVEVCSESGRYFLTDVQDGTMRSIFCLIAGRSS